MANREEMRKIFLYGSLATFLDINAMSMAGESGTGKVRLLQKLLFSQVFPLNLLQLPSHSHLASSIELST